MQWIWIQVIGGNIECRCDCIVMLDAASSFLTFSEGLLPLYTTRDRMYRFVMKVVDVLMHQCH